MPKFRNVSNDERYVPAYGKKVAPGDVLEVPKEDIDGFAGQDAVWEPVATQTKHAVKQAVEDAK